MKVELELYLVKLVPDGIHYVRKALIISQDLRDPDKIASEYLEFIFSDNKVITEKDRYILHSTSWRYEQPQNIVLTYLAYSDLFSFQSMNPGLLRFNEIEIATSNNPKIPRPERILPKTVISHGIRHLAFLLSTDKKGIFRQVVNNETVKVFTQIDQTFAGRLD